MKNEHKLLRIIRLWTVFYIIALVFWGVTAFPLQSEMSLLCNLFNISPDVSPDAYSGLKHWLATVYQGLSETNASYPFLAYGTDWLAFSHIVIAVAFVGVYFKPIRNKWVVYWGMVACLGIIPLAVICGAIREIPFYWRLIDCSFGVFGAVPLWILHRYIGKLEAEVGKPEYTY